MYTVLGNYGNSFYIIIQTFTYIQDGEGAEISPNPLRQT